VSVDYSTVDFYCLFFGEVIFLFITASTPLLDRRMLSLRSISNCSLILGAEVFDCKLKPAQLNSVSPTEFIVLYVLISRFEVPDYNEHAIALILRRIRAFFLVDGIVSHIKFA
jgi:hypothetical protein